MCWLLPVKMVVLHPPCGGTVDACTWGLWDLVHKCWGRRSHLPAPALSEGRSRAFHNNPIPGGAGGPASGGRQRLLVGKGLLAYSVGVQSTQAPGVSCSGHKT